MTVLHSYACSCMLCCCFFSQTSKREQHGAQHTATSTRAPPGCMHEERSQEHRAGADLIPLHCSIAAATSQCTPRRGTEALSEDDFAIEERRGKKKLLFQFCKKKRRNASTSSTESRAYLDGEAGPPLSVDARGLARSGTASAAWLVEENARSCCLCRKSVRGMERECNNNKGLV